MSSNISILLYREIIKYTVLHIFVQVLFLAGNQGNHQNFEPSILPYKFGLIFMGMKQYIFFFSKISQSFLGSKNGSKF